MIVRLAALGLAIATGALPASAQGFSPWDDEPFWERPSQRMPARRARSSDGASQQPAGEAVRNGGARPNIAPEAPPVVNFNYAKYPAGSIVIDSKGRKLYFVLNNNRAFQYPISVGREGFAWAGKEKISRVQAWPDWHPPAEMRKREPKLPKKMTGGLRNPLGAMALYLGNTLYRIHGTNDEKTIGFASSSGCFRMMNSNVLHLAQFAKVGTEVSVVNSLPNPPASPAIADNRRRGVPPVALNRAGEDDDRVVRPGDRTRRSIQREDDDYVRQLRRQPPGRLDDRPLADNESDIADVTITSRNRDRFDDYDPYQSRRRSYRRRYSARDRDFDDWPDVYGPDSYAYDRPGGRIWYDDDRDDL